CVGNSAQKGVELARSDLGETRVVAGQGLASSPVCGGPAGTGPPPPCRPFVCAPPTLFQVHGPWSGLVVSLAALSRSTTPVHWLMVACCSRTLSMASRTSGDAGGCESVPGGSPYFFSTWAAWRTVGGVGRESSRAMIC